MEKQLPSQSQEIQSRLDQMGHDNLIKYLGKQTEQKQKRMEQSEKKEIIFPREEIEQIRQVNVWINKILSEVKRKQTENPQKYKNGNYEKRVLKLIMDDLDKLDLWKCKFSTSNNAVRGEDISPKESDSIYYMTPNGASLRFKMIMFNKNNRYMEEYGIHYVKQDFATFIYFSDRHKGSANPIVGNSDVKEIFDEDFQTLISQEKPIEKDYSTGFAALIDKDGLWSATTIGQQEHTDVRTHEGSLVNKIFFNRSKHINNK